ncbi:MAG: single-stranded DNA-binding protein [bacterium]|nr:single-stranded DNA-binding protein [bacterium]
MAGASYNKIILVGRLTRDPESRTTASGTQMTRFSLAVDRVPSRNADPSAQNTDFFTVSAFNRLAEICSRYLTKGRLVLVEGALHVDSVPQPDGTNRTYVNVWANEMKMLSSGYSDQPGAPAPQVSRDSYSRPAPAPVPDPLDDMGEGDDGEMDVPF